jgi:hypothetical protein
MRSWKLPKRDLPTKEGFVSRAEDERWVEMNAEDFKNLLGYCADNYFKDKRYWLIEGKPSMTMYYVNGIVDLMGREKVAEMIYEGKKYLRQKGFEGLFLSGVVTEPINVDGLGFDALTGYNFLPDFSANADFIQDYKVLSNKRVSDWKKIKEVSSLPYIPSISAGWDATPRGEKVKDIFSEQVFPWKPIVVNNAPENFQEFLRKGIEFSKDNLNMVNICAWNEWGEGSYLEPDAKRGFALLEKVRETRQRLYL